MIKTFKRVELKYFLTSEQYSLLRIELDKRMDLDKFCRKNGSYMIYNLYFDTDHNDIIRQSLAKPYYKEKLRMRSYALLAGSDQHVFLELKKKIGGTVTKRRAVLPLTQANDFLESGIIPEGDYKDSQVLAEIAYFLKRNPAKPRVFISYERIAFFAKDNPELRISFDQNILARRSDVNLISGNYGQALVNDNRLLMEIKCDGTIPLWLSDLLSELKIYKTSFSKYGTEYQYFVKHRFPRKTSA